MPLIYHQISKILVSAWYMFDPAITLTLPKKERPFCFVVQFLLQSTVPSRFFQKAGRPQSDLRNTPALRAAIKETGQKGQLFAKNQEDEIIDELVELVQGLAMEQMQEWEEKKKQEGEQREIRRRELEEKEKREQEEPAKKQAARKEEGRGEEQQLENLLKEEGEEQQLVAFVEEEREAESQEEAMMDLWSSNVMSL